MAFYAQDLTTAEGQKLEHFIWKASSKYYENLVNPLCSKTLPVFYLTQSISIYKLWSL